MTDDAFLMLRKAVGNADPGGGIRLGTTDIVRAAELVEAEYATVRDTDDRIKLRATPAGVEYMKMIDTLLAVPDYTTNMSGFDLRQAQPH